VAKSIVSALVGIAIERRLIPDVETPIATYFPELKRERDQRKLKITVEDLLTMRPGLESTSNRNYGAWVQSRNWVQYALSRPMLADPGEWMDYSTGNTHLLSAIITKVTGSSTWQFANDTLARPLGFTLARWPRDPQGIYFGGNDMLLTPRQMLSFGELYLRGGEAGGKPIVPERWIETSIVPRGRSGWSGQRYGYGWWVRDLAGHRAHYAWGFGGQYIVIVPDLELVVVATSASTVAEDRRSHRVSLFDLIEQQIVAPIAAAS
jgi:CubicO group peptidase (beta-lactamase class C family)